MRKWPKARVSWCFNGAYIPLCIIKKQTVRASRGDIRLHVGDGRTGGGGAGRGDWGALTALRSVSKLRRMSPMGFSSSATMLSNRCEFMLHRESRCDILKTIRFHWKHHWDASRPGLSLAPQTRRYECIAKRWRETLCHSPFFDLHIRYAKLLLYMLVFQYTAQLEIPETLRRVVVHLINTKLYD